MLAEVKLLKIIAFLIFLAYSLKFIEDMISNLLKIVY